MPAPQKPATPDEEIHVIHTMPRAEGEEIQFVLKKYRGRCYIDVRIWFREEGKSELYPTKRGISLPVERLTELQEGLEQLSKALVVAGEWSKPQAEKPVQKFGQKPQKNWAR